MVKLSKSWIVVWSGPALRVEFPPEPINQVLADCATLEPVALRVIHDTMYSGSPLVTEWNGTIFNYHSSRVDLRGRSIKSLWGELTKQHRNSIRQAIRKGVKVHMGVNVEDFNTFMSLTTTLAERRGFGWSKESNLKPIWEGGLAKVWIATVNDHPAAVAFIEHSPSVARFAYGAGDPEYYQYRPSNYLHWRIMTDAFNKGLSIYDLGGGSNLFKRGFGSVTYPYQILEWNKEKDGPLKV